MTNPTHLSEVDFGDHASKPSSDKLEQLTDLVQEMELAEVALAEAEATLAQRKARLKGIVEHELPELMLELNQPILTTSDGRQIEIEDVVRGSLPAANRAKGFQWLIDNDQAGLIKRTVEVAFAAVEGEKAQELLGSMEKDFGANARQIMKVEGSTMSSFIRKQMKAEEAEDYDGPRLPKEIFTVYQAKQAKIKKK